MHILRTISTEPYISFSSRPPVCAGRTTFRTFHYIHLEGAIMSSSSLPGSTCLPTSSRVKHGSGFNPVTSTFTPFGRYVDVGSHKIKSSHPGLRLHGWSTSSPRSCWKLINHTKVGSSSTLYLNKGTLLGLDITYISQV